MATNVPGCHRDTERKMQPELQMRKGIMEGRNLFLTARRGGKRSRQRAPCPNCAQRDVTERFQRHGTQRPVSLSYCKVWNSRGLGTAVRGLKIRRPSGLGGSTPP